MATHSTAQYSIEHQIQDIQLTNMAYFGSRVIESVLHTLIHIQCTHHSRHTHKHTLRPKKETTFWIYWCIIMVQILIQPYSVTLCSDLVSVLLNFLLSFPFRSVRFGLVPLFDHYIFIHIHQVPSSLFPVPHTFSTLATLFFFACCFHSFSRLNLRKIHILNSTTHSSFACDSEHTLQLHNVIPNYTIWFIAIYLGGFFPDHSSVLHRPFVRSFVRSLVGSFFQISIALNIHYFRFCCHVTQQQLTYHQ